MDVLKRNNKFYFSNDDTFKNPLDNAHYYIMKNYEIGMHKQGFFEINIITRGTGTHYMEDRAIAATVGDVFIIPPDVEHGYTGGEGFDVYHVIINNKFMSQNLLGLQCIDGFSVLFNAEPLIRARSNEQLHLRLDEAQSADIAHVLNIINEIRRYTNPSDAYVCTGLTLILISKLCEIYIKNAKSSFLGANMQDTAFMKAIAMIHERYSEKLTIEELSKAARLSKSTFIRKFVDICKMPPNEYITKTRLEMAENMLSDATFPLSEIAEKCGFYDSAHFSRTFKKRTGITPSEYRKRVRSENNL